MAENSKIEWTHHTFNPWIGCSKVSPGCAHCYAEELMDHRYGRVQWGPNGTRSLTSDATWKEPIRWDKAAKEAGESHRVFCASLADVMEDRPELALWRERLFSLIQKTRNLSWLLLTKRPENFARFLPWSLAGAAAEKAVWPHVWLGTSVEDRQRATERIPLLRGTPAAVRFLSVEPLIEDLGPLDLSGIHWVIIGGESGRNARTLHLDWARSIVRQCREQRVAVFVKQLGHRPVDHQKPQRNFFVACSLITLQLRDSKGGDITEWPVDLTIREFPNGRSCT